MTRHIKVVDEVEFAALRTLAIGLLDGIARNAAVRVTPEILACLLEWAELPETQTALPVVRELMAKLNANIATLAGTASSRNRAERRKRW